MDTGHSGFPRDDIRVSDADRDQAISELSEHFQTGRLTQEEFDERSSQALAAKTGADLRQLFTDLPRQAGRPTPPMASPFPDTYDPHPPARHFHPGRLIVAAVVAAIIVGNVLSVSLGHAHFSGGWLIPVVILSFIFLRSGRR